MIVGGGRGKASVWFTLNSLYLQKIPICCLKGFQELLVLFTGDNHFSFSVKKSTVTASCLLALCWQGQSFREASVAILLKGNELLYILHDTGLLPSPEKNLSTQLHLTPSYTWRHFLTGSSAERELSNNQLVLLPHWNYMVSIPWVLDHWHGSIF